MRIENGIFLNGNESGLLKFDTKDGDLYFPRLLCLECKREANSIIKLHIFKEIKPLTTGALVPIECGYCDNKISIKLTMKEYADILCKGF